MARLWDAARMNRGGYSLEGLSSDLLSRRKVSMKDLFGHPKVHSIINYKQQATNIWNRLEKMEQKA